MGRRVLAFVLLELLLLVVVVSLLVLTPAAVYLHALVFPSPTPKPTPILTVRGTPPPINATAAYVLDADSHHTLVNIQGQKHLPMASTTKIMTAIIAIEQGKLDQVITVQQDAVNEVRKNDGSNAQLVVGDKLRLEDLLYALMLPSGDDAAIVIADAVGGSTARFVAMMNAYAHRLHLTQTHYINPDGLTYLTPQGKPRPDHYTTAADLVHLTQYALSNSLFAQIVQLQRYTLPATDMHHAYIWDNTDMLLNSYPGVTGVKTGYTVEAGYCLVFAATDGKHHLIGAILNDKDADQRFTDAGILLNWAFALPLLPPPPPTP